MRLFIRSYTKYIDADYEQALVDYELYTTGKVQPKFFDDTEQADNQTYNNSLNPKEGFNISDDFQVNYKQIITIILTIIAIYSGFKLIEFISNDDSGNQTQDSSISLVETP